MKNLFILLVSSFSFVASNAQPWNALPGSNGLILGAGIYTTTVYNGNLVIGGNFHSLAGPYVNLMQWNGSSLDSVGGPIGYVYALTVFNGNLIAGGNFNSAGHIHANSIAQWNGIAWDSLGKGIKGIVNALTEYNGKLVVGGNFDSVGGKPVNNIAIWDGSSWSALGTGTNAPVLSVFVYNGDLVAGGDFSVAGGWAVNNIAQWNGSSWSKLGAGTNGSVCALCVYGGKLLAGGGFDSAGGSPAHSAACWNGSNWLALGGGPNGVVYSLTVYNGAVIAGGTFDSINGVQDENVAQWNGVSWDSVGSGLSCSPRNVEVNTLIVYNGNLYGAGYFYYSGKVIVNSIAEWGSPLAVNEINVESSELKVYPNPSKGLFNLSISNGGALTRSENNNSSSNYELGMKYSIEVYNALGQQVYSNTVLIPDSSFQIDLTAQPSGIYLYRVITESGTLVGEGKLVKE
jgi:hypothetical protein